jgi:hypothetical protein
MKAFDEYCQPAKGIEVRRALLAILACIAVPDPCAARARHGSEAIDMLVQADALRAQALAFAEPDRRASTLIDSLELVKGAFGQVFAPGGEVASLDYEARLAEARGAVHAAGSPASLVERMDKVAPVTRGVAGGRVEKAVELSGPVTLKLKFEAGKPAIIYARTQFPATLHLVVRDAGGNKVCDQARSSGRVLCRWLPIAQQSVAVEAVALDPHAAGVIRIFTN